MFAALASKNRAIAHMVSFWVRTGGAEALSGGREVRAQKPPRPWFTG